MAHRLLLIAVLALLMLPAAVARAHETCCGHDHTGSDDGNSSNTCDSNVACEKPWDHGTCVDKNTHGYAYCSCQWDLAMGDYALLLVNTLTSLGGPPAPDTTISYQTSIGPNSFGELVFRDATVVSFPPNAAGPGGFVSLAFGSFADPAAVPVTVEQWFFEFPPGAIGGSPTGPSSTALDPENSAQLVYNANTNVLSTPAGESMLLTVTNGVHTNAPLQLLWSGVLDATPGQETLQAQFQSVPNAPPPLPALQTAGTYLLCTALLLLVIAGPALRRRR